MAGLNAQFGFVSVDMDLRQIRDSEKNFLKSLPEDISSYIQNANYAPEADDLNLELKIRVIPEKVPRNGNERTITSQILFTNEIDQTYFAKSVKFKYAPGIQLNYNPTFHPLRSILDYYAMLILGSEMDIWDKLGGQAYLKTAENVAVMGKESNFSDGWSERQRRAENVVLSTEFRESKYYFFLMMDAFYAKEPDSSLVKNAAATYFAKAMEIPDEFTEHKYTRNFFASYCEEIVRIFTALNLNDELAEFQYLDPENKSLYLLEN